MRLRFRWLRQRCQRRTSVAYRCSVSAASGMRIDRPTEAMVSDLVGPHVPGAPTFQTCRVWPRPRQSRAGPCRRPVGPRLHRSGTQPALGRGLHVCAHLGRVRLRGVHRRRVRPTHRGLARRNRPAHRPGPDAAAHRPVGPRPVGHPRAARPAAAPLRRGQPIPLDPVHRAPRDVRHRPVDRHRWRRLRQRADGKLSSVCSRPSASRPRCFTTAPTRPSAMSSTPPRDGSIGTTTDACTGRLACSPQPSMNSTTTLPSPPRNSPYRSGKKPVTVQFYGSCASHRGSGQAPGEKFHGGSVLEGSHHRGTGRSDVTSRAPEEQFPPCNREKERRMANRPPDGNRRRSDVTTRAPEEQLPLCPPGKGASHGNRPPDRPAQQAAQARPRRASVLPRRLAHTRTSARVGTAAASATLARLGCLRYGT